jgi:aminoglycoside 2''-phosphotransferase
MNNEARIDAVLVAEVIREQFPDLRPGQVRWIGEGYDSVAFEVGDEWVFRFPKRDDVEQQLLVEMRLLPVLARHSPLRVPEYEFRGSPTRRFPRHYGGYRRVPGVPAIGIDPDSLPLDRLAPSLAVFLSWLHTFPADRAAELGVERQGPDPGLGEARTEALEDLEYVTRAAPDLVVRDWVEFLSRAPAAPAESHRKDRLVHGDLAAEHILYDSATRSLTGVIDWSEVSIGDPSVDLAGVLHWGGDRFLDMVLSTYRGPADDGTLDRARYRAACRGMGDIVFGMEMGRDDYVAAGVRALNFSIQSR